MTLRVPDPPEASVAALHDSLGALAERGQFGARRLRKARPEAPSAALPHQVFILGLADAAEGALDRAEPSGWRYLIEADQEVVASGETRLEGDNTHTFSHINEVLSCAARCVRSPLQRQLRTNTSTHSSSP